MSTNNDQDQPAAPAVTPGAQETPWSDPDEVGHTPAPAQGAQSPTPRTDAFTRAEHVAYDSMWINLGRQLERELNEAKQAAAGFLSDAQKAWAEGDTLRQQLDRLAAQHARIDELRHKAEAELAALRLDRERLDWLEANGNLPLIYRTSVGLSERSTKDVWYWDYRAAIDSAMKQEGGK